MLYYINGLQLLFFCWSCFALFKCALNNKIGVIIERFR